MGIATICGSTRFRAEFAEANRMLTLAGQIVLAPGVFAHDGDAITDEQKVALDALHLRKIDLSAWVYVVNPGGYIGESTRREIEYARRTGKGVLALVDVGVDGWSAEAQAAAAVDMVARRAAVGRGWPTTRGRCSPRSPLTTRRRCDVGRVNDPVGLTCNARMCRAPAKCPP